VHAFSAILYDCDNLEDYVDECYTVETYKKAYAPIIYPMPSEEQWVKTSNDKLKPPVARVTPRRPKKLRKRAPDESRDPKNLYRMRKFGSCGKCSNYKGLGHNKRACPMTRSVADNVGGSAQSFQCTTSSFCPSNFFFFFFF
jgi:hypothetical protein